VLLALATLACKSQQSKAEQARDELSSWAATGEKLAREWSRHTLTKPYVKRTGKVAHDSLKKLGEPLKDDKAATARLSRTISLYDDLLRQVDRP